MKFVCGCVGEEIEAQPIIVVTTLLDAKRKARKAIDSLLATVGKSTRRRLYRLLLEQVATDLLPSRPHRSEPRVVKRRPKPFPRMQQPRSVLKANSAA